MAFKNLQRHRMVLQECPHHFSIIMIRVQLEVLPQAIKEILHGALVRVQLVETFNCSTICCDEEGGRMAPSEILVKVYDKA